MGLRDSNEVVEQCFSACQVKTDRGKGELKTEPCPRIVKETNTCNTYLWPAAKWHQRACPMSRRPVEETAKQKLNPLKASKRASKNK